MKTFSLVVLFVLALCCVPAAAQTEPLDGRVTTAVPFEFVVGDQVMPPGNYIIQPTGTHDTWQIKNVDDPSIQAYVLVNDLDARDVNEDTRMIFSNVGGKRVLTEVWAKGTTHGQGFAPR